MILIKRTNEWTRYWPICSTYFSFILFTLTWFVRKFDFSQKCATLSLRFSMAALWNPLGIFSGFWLVLSFNRTIVFLACCCFFLLIVLRGPMLVIHGQQLQGEPFFRANACLVFVGLGSLIFANSLLLALRNRFGFDLLTYSGVCPLKSCLLYTIAHVLIVHHLL